MGGKALQKKGLVPRRISTEEQKTLIEEFRKRTKTMFQKIEPILSTKDKTNHGDTDLVCLIHSTQKSSLQPTLLKTLQPKAFLKNDNILSLEFHDTQFDLALYSNPTHFQTHLQFCHHSPLGNILGQMIKQTGCKYTLKGLVLPIPQKLEPLILSENIEEILHFSGLEFEKWKNGFQSQNELYTYCTQAKLFNPKIFQRENLNHKNRQRLVQRPDYQNWIQFLEKQNLPPHPFTEKTSEDWIQTLQQNFPKKLISETLKKAQDAANQKKESHKKFNGALFSQLTGLKGPNLGKALKKFQENIEKKENFSEWILKTSNKTITSEIKKFIDEPTDPNLTSP